MDAETRSSAYKYNYHSHPELVSGYIAREVVQEKHDEWYQQFVLYGKELEDHRFLYDEWILPVKFSDMRGEKVFEAGAGPGVMTRFIAEYADEVVAVDLNTVEHLKRNVSDYKNVRIVEGDIAEIDFPGEKFDVTFCVGVIHHTQDPTKTFQNLFRQTRKGGRVVIWTYSYEGNFLVRKVVEPIRKAFLKNLDRRTLWFLSGIITFFMYVPIYSVYLLPLKFLPFYEYFENWRKMSFRRNLGNVFDKLNAPLTIFTKYSTISSWFNENDFQDIVITKYKGTSWRGTGIKND